MRSYELSLDGKKLLVRKGEDLYVVRRRRQGAGRDSAKDAGRRSTTGSFTLDPRDEWRQMFVEAWRLERDYFYDRGMHGVDWPAMQAQVPAAGASG